MIVTDLRVTNLRNSFHPAPKPKDEKKIEKIQKDAEKEKIKKKTSKTKKKTTKKRKPIKGKKHKQTKEKEIPKKVKEVVWRRDKKQYIFCQTPVDISHANAHFIPRSAGGLGIEENIFTACDQCHHEQDNGLNTKEYDQKAKRHLKKIYGSKWTIEKLIYNKYKEETKNDRNNTNKNDKNRKSK